MFLLNFLGLILKTLLVIGFLFVAYLSGAFEYKLIRLTFGMLFAVTALMVLFQGDEAMATEANPDPEEGSADGIRWMAPVLGILAVIMFMA